MSRKTLSPADIARLRDMRSVHVVAQSNPGAFDVQRHPGSKILTYAMTLAQLPLMA
jgi:hypothetical protein